MDVAVAKCYADKIRLKARPIITGDAYSEQRTPTPKRVESHQSRTEAQERYEGKKSETPSGFHDLLQKVVRAVVLARPAHLYRFIADVLEAELTERTLNDIVSRCALMKSRKLEPTESCSLLASFVNQTRLEIYGEEQFTMGPIPDYELQKPALDRYRDYAGISPFDMSFELPCDVAPTAAEQQESPPEVECPRPEPEKPPPPPREPERIRFDRGPVPEYQLGEPALDRYRDYAGIGPFELDECVPHTSLCRQVTSSIPQHIVKCRPRFAPYSWPNLDVFRAVQLNNGGLGPRPIVAVTRWSRSVTQLLYTLGPISSGMGECLRAGKLPHYVTSNPGQLSLPSIRGRK